MRVLASCLAAGTAIAIQAAIPTAYAQQDASRAALPVYARSEGLARLPATEIFESDDILAASVDQIRRLGRRETEALARVLADCQDAPTPNVMGDGYCRRARAYFEIVAMPNGPLGFLFAVLSNRLAWVNAEWQRGDSLERALVLRRLARIEGMWRAAVYSRLVALDQERR